MDHNEWFEPLPHEAEVPEQPVMPVFKLNEGQQAAHDAIVAAILDQSLSSWKGLLEGPAGTGKTFTVNRIVETVRVKAPWINFGMTAPTHKAVRQLKKHSEIKDDQLDFGTIHSFLGLKEKYVDNPKKPGEQMVTYELDWDSKKERKIDGIHVLIIDESSMLGSVLYGHIDDVARSRPDLKVLFMGDGVQIPPVREKEATGSADAIPFIPEQRKSRRIEHFKLDEVVRQGAGNPIIEYATAIRLNYKNQSIPFDFSHANGVEHGIEVLNRSGAEGLVRILFDTYFNTDKFREDPDYIKAVAWRNVTVDFFNKMIRSIVFGKEELPKMIVGEKLILDKPVVKNDKIVLPNNEELHVLTLREGTHVHRYRLVSPAGAFEAAASDGTVDLNQKQLRQEEFKVYYATVRTPEKKVYEIIVLHEDSEGQYARVREELARSAKKCYATGNSFEGRDMWAEFFKMEKVFAWVKYNYCLTAHKAQGSTYDYCISMEWDINLNHDVEERNRIKYVAATRARNKLFIIK